MLYFPKFPAVVFAPFQPMFLRFTLSSLLLPFLFIYSLLLVMPITMSCTSLIKSSISVFLIKKLYVYFFNHLQKWLIPSRGRNLFCFLSI